MARLIQSKQIGGVSIDIFNEVSASLAQKTNELASVDANNEVKGAFRVFDTYAELEAEPINLISDNQIVWVEERQATYQATITLANLVDVFENTVQWNVFEGFSFREGDINSIVAGNGLIGGGNTGSISLSIGEGDGISVSATAVSINTGSNHFYDGVEKIVIVTELDGGNI